MTENEGQGRALFLDRDGVINRQVAGYVTSWEEVELLPGALAALARLAAFDGPVLVISNQSAIARGLVAAETVAEIHARLRALVATAGGRIDGFYVCPHHPEAGCGCRKPRPGLLQRAAAEHGLALEKCVFVGDAVTDYQAALAAGCASILVRSGRQGGQIDALAASVHAAQGVDTAAPVVVANLAAAADELEARGLLAGRDLAAASGVVKKDAARDAFLEQTDRA